MDTRDTIAMLTWINQVDPRVALNEAAAETWAYGMGSIATADAKQAVLEHYRLNEETPATPAAIRKRAVNLQASREGRQNALEAGPRQARNPLSYRARNPDLWDELYEQGRAQRAAELARR